MQHLVLSQTPTEDSGVFTRRFPRRAKDLQGGFLISDQFSSKSHTYWVNPRAIGTDLAQVTKITNIPTEEDFTELVEFVKAMIINSKFLVIPPNRETIEKIFPRLDPAIFISRDAVNKEIIDMNLPSRETPSCLNTKLVTIALKRIETKDKI